MCVKWNEKLHFLFVFFFFDVFLEGEKSLNEKWVFFDDDVGDDDDEKRHLENILKNILKKIRIKEQVKAGKCLNIRNINSLLLQLL